VKVRCAARSKQTGERCKLPPTAGHNVCRFHGSRSPQAKAAAEQRRQRTEAERVMRMLGEPIDTTPAEALLDTVKRTAGYVAFLREQVAQVEADELVWGRTKETDGHAVVGTGPRATLQATTDQVREAKPNAWLTLLGEWQDRLVKTCTACLTAGIEERRVRLAEQQGALVADVIRGVLADLGLNAEQSALVAEVVPRHLRLLTA
jgi:hypothetical protein